MKIGSEVLWLSDSDVIELLTMKEAIAAMELGFTLYGQNKAQMPPKAYLNFENEGGDLRSMPAYLKGESAMAGVKIVNSTPQNPAKGLPAVAGILVLVDPQTGLPLGVFSAHYLTAIRTGAVGGLAAKVLARKNSKTVGLVGCGYQAYTQLKALNENFSIEKVLVWGKTIEEAEKFCQKIKNGVPCKEVKEVCQGDIVVTTTPVRTPLVKKDWISAGTHINAIGADAPGKQELEADLLKSSKVVVDEWVQCSHGGEINNCVRSGQFKQSHVAASLGEIMINKKKGGTHENDITIFDSTGLAIQDVAVGKILYDKAIKLNKGQVLKLHG